ncbi:MAG: Bug family tripartite tricarboxylate transporter substrate binding protein [Lautropia sp.]
MKWLIHTVALMVALAQPAASQAQDYPNRPVTLVVPYPAGGPTDNIGRMIAAELAQRLKNPVVVINRGGAGGTIGSASVARAEPDGYTLLLATSDHSTNPIAYPSIPYNTEEAFVPVALISTSALLLIVNQEFPVRSIADLIAYGKSRPGEIRYATSTIGGNTHLAAELFSQMAGVRMTQVPYQGGAASMTDLIGGQVQVMFSAMGSSLPMVESGKVRALGVTTAKPTAVAPDLPPIATTLPGFDVGAWYGIVAPRGTPRAIVEQLNRQVNEIARTPEFGARLRKFGSDAAQGSADEFGEFIRQDVRRWADVAKRANFVSPNKNP